MSSFTSDPSSSNLIDNNSDEGINEAESSQGIPFIEPETSHSVKRSLLHRRTSHSMSFDKADKETGVPNKHAKEEAVIEIGGQIRPPMNQAEFDDKFSYKIPEEGSELSRRLKKLARSYYEPFTSWVSFKYAFLSFVPFLEWFPKYQWKQDILYDLIGGITLGIMHVPQGVAYALLAKQEAVIGLYTSFFPPLLYMFFGTSRHNSIGSFAVVALMTGLAVERLTGASGPEEWADMPVEGDADGMGKPTAAEVAAILTIAVGIVQLIMGVLRLSFLTAYFSDQLVAGFTTGASVHVFVSQLKDLLGIGGLPGRGGPGNLIMKVYDICLRLPDTNILAVVISLATIAVLLIGKDIITPWFNKKIKLPMPLPFELFMIICWTAISAIFDLHGNYALKILHKIPTGFPAPSLPRFSILPFVIPDAIAIAIVVVAVHISLAKMFAKKLGYSVDPGQELFALGVTSVGSGFLPVYPVACSLGRTLVNSCAGTRTQLSTIFSSVLVVSVILYFGKWMETLPMCVLAATVVAALVTMLDKFKDLKTLWPISKIDFSIWVVSFVSTVAVDVMEGLAISILFALFTTIMREQWPRWHLLGNVSGTTDYRDSERYGDVYFFHGICMFRFDSPLLFTNVERFKRTVNKAYKEWERSHEFYVLRSERKQQLMLEAAIQGDNEQTVNSGVTGLSTASNGLLSRHFIIDCSGFTFVDYMGVSTLKEVYSDMRSRGILVYFAAAKAPVRDLFESSGFYSFVAKENFYPTIRDAVAIARRTQLASGQEDSLYTPEHDRLSEIISSHPMY